MAFYVGMDVHRKRSQVAIMDERGEEILNRNLPNDPTVLVPILDKLPPSTPVAFEAAYGWGWLVDLLDGLALEPHLAHAKNCKAIASARLKHDKVDARTLAHLLRANLLAEAWIAPVEIRDLRALLRHRAFLVRMRTIFKARIHAILADQGIHPKGPLWSQPGRKALATMPLPIVQRHIVDDCLALIDALEVPIAHLEGEITTRAKPDARVAALQMLPGIGQLTAMTLVAEIGEISRFPTARKLCAWAGLTPTVRNSDRRIRHGHITKQGSPWVRWILSEAAQTAKRRPPLARAYVKIFLGILQHLGIIRCASRRPDYIQTVHSRGSRTTRASGCVQRAPTMARKLRIHRPGRQLPDTRSLRRDGHLPLSQCRKLGLLVS